MLLLALLLALALLPEVPGLQLVRLAAFDAYQNLAPRERRSAPVVIVAIDEESLERYGQWPWPRTWLARLVARIGEARPAAIGLDIMMPEPDRLSPERIPSLVDGLDPELTRKLAGMPRNDAVLAAALRGRPVVLGMAGLESVPGPPAGIGQVPVRAFGGDPAPFVRPFAGALRSVDEIDAAAAGRGLMSMDPERGVVRRMPMLASLGGTLAPILGIEMLRVAAKVPAL
ncbi:MAG TPA: CHASE2 domain-containing protein, partial [Methylomirabilota bacterium]|nr:CHASE2 domain-containing protein [Methylomirabilota bacterium]